MPRLSGYVGRPFRTWDEVIWASDLAAAAPRAVKRDAPPKRSSIVTTGRTDDVILPQARASPRAATNGTVTVEVVTPPESYASETIIRGA